MSRAAAYHFHPTRHLIIRLPSSRRPARPSVTPITTSAAISGPAAMKAPTGTVTHVSTKASPKNAAIG